MKYYLITSQEYQDNHSTSNNTPVYSVDESQCILEVEDNYEVLNYIQMFNTADEVNDFRFDPLTNEYQNWVTEEDEYVR